MLYTKYQQIIDNIHGLKVQLRTSHDEIELDIEDCNVSPDARNNKTIRDQHYFLKKELNSLKEQIEKSLELFNKE